MLGSLSIRPGVCCAASASLIPVTSTRCAVAVCMGAWPPFASPRSNILGLPPAGRGAAAVCTAAADDQPITTQALMALTRVDLQARCKALGLPITGRKDVLAGRIMQHMSGQASSEDEDDGQDQEGLESLSFENVRSFKSAQLRQWLLDRDMEAMGMKRSDLVRTVEMVLSEEEGAVPVDGVRAAQLSEPRPGDRFGRYSDEELQTMAEDLGLPSEGDRADLVDMLSAVANEQQMPSIPAPRIKAADPSSLPGSATSWPSSPPAMTQFLMDDLPGAGPMDPAAGDEFDALLYGSAPGDSSLPDLWRESDEQLTARLSSMPLDTLSIRELKAELKQLGMPTYGTRAVLLQRLEEAVRVLQQQESGVEEELLLGADAEVAAEAARLVAAMPLRQLQEELRGRGVEPRGTKALLQDMLQQMLVKEAASQGGEEEPTDVLLSGQSSLGANPPIPQDPPLHVALLCTPHTLPLARHALDRLLCSTGALRSPTGEEGEAPATYLQGTLYLYVPEAGVFRLGVAQAYGSTALDTLTAMANGVPAVGAPVAPSLEALAAVLKQDCQDVLLPMVHPGDVGDSDALHTTLTALATTLPTVAAAATDSLLAPSAMLEAVRAAGLPVLPWTRLGGVKGGAEQLAAWVEGVEDVDGQHTRMVVQRDVACDGVGPPALARGVKKAARAAAGLLEDAPEIPVLVQPVLPRAVRWVVSVVPTPQGPLALIPTEAEVVDVEDGVLEMHLEMEMWHGKQDGYRESYIQLLNDQTRRRHEDFVANGSAVFDAPRTPLQRVLWHSPPRLPADVCHCIRRSATRMFQELGLEDAAVFEGLVQLPATPPAADPAPELVPCPEPHEMGGDAALRLFGRMGLSEFVEVEEDELDIPMEELFAPQPAGETAVDEDGEQFLDAAPEDPGDPWPPGFEEEGRAALAEFTKAYEPELADEATSRAINEAMAAGEWVEEEEEEELAEEAGPIIPDVTAMTAEQLSRSPHGTVYVTAATPLPLLPARLARYLYHQAALIGLAPEDLLRGALNAALEKAGVPPAPLAEAGEEAETMATADGRALHQLPLLGPWNVYRSALLPTPVRTLYMDMLVRCFPKEDGDDETEWKEEDEEALRKQAFDMQYSMFADQGYRDPRGALQGSTSNSYLGADPGGFDPYSANEAPPQGEDGEWGAGAGKGLPPSPPPPSTPADGVQRVWVLVGGEGSAGEVSLASGQHILQQLQHEHGVQTELFMLAPHTWSRAEPARRQELLVRRRNLLQLNLPEEEIPEELSLPRIRNPMPAAAGVAERLVWALPPHMLERVSAADVVVAAEAALEAETRVPHVQEPVMQQQQAVLKQVQAEVGASDLQGVSRLWGGDPRDLAPPPRVLDMETFALEARQRSAVVFVAAMDEVALSGALAMGFEEMGVRFTGAGWMATQMCNDLVTTASQLAGLESSGINVAPQQTVPKSQLDAAMLAIPTHPVEPDTLPHPLQQLFDEWRAAVGSPDALAIRPAKGAGLGDATTLRIGSAAELYTLAMGLTARWPTVPQDHLPNQPWEATLPVTPPTDLLIEPFISSDVVLGDDGLVMSQGEGRWVEVACYVVGEAGAMAALTPSVIVRPVPGTPPSTLQDELQHACRCGSNAVALTPPPASIVSQAAIEGSKQRIEMVADKLGLSGWARIDGFVHGDSGEIIVTGAHAVPPFTPGAPIMQQIISHEPEPILPTRFLMELVHLAMLRSPPGGASGGEGEVEDDVFGDDDMYGGGLDGEEWSSEEWPQPVT